MPMLEWNNGLSVQVKEIDEQHKKLVGMINTLFDSMKSETDDTVLLSIVDEMVKYAVEHFNTEERYMEKMGYPEFERHKSEHQDFVEKATQVENDLKYGKTVLSMDILNFLSSWLVTHINGTDKKMGVFLSENGAS